jgi:hypothetical protein
MSIDRLTAEDRIMLWGDEVWPQEIGALAVLDGTGLLDPAGRFWIEAVRDAIECRLHLSGASVPATGSRVPYRQ